MSFDYQIIFMNFDFQIIVKIFSYQIIIETGFRKVILFIKNICFNSYLKF